MYKNVANVLLFMKNFKDYYDSMFENCAVKIKKQLSYIYGATFGFFSQPKGTTDDDNLIYQEFCYPKNESIRGFESFLENQIAYSNYLSDPEKFSAFQLLIMIFNAIVYESDIELSNIFSKLILKISEHITEDLLLETNKLMVKEYEKISSIITLSNFKDGVIETLFHKLEANDSPFLISNYNFSDYSNADVHAMNCLFLNLFSYICTKKGIQIPSVLYKVNVELDSVSSLDDIASDTGLLHFYEIQILSFVESALKEATHKVISDFEKARLEEKKQKAKLQAHKIFQNILEGKQNTLVSTSYEGPVLTRGIAISKDIQNSLKDNFVRDALLKECEEYDYNVSRDNSFLRISSLTIAGGKIIDTDSEIADNRKGFRYESEVAISIKKAYPNACVILTQCSNDYGCDVLIDDGKKRYVIQSKEYSKAVGKSAVQEIVTAKAFYRADESLVFTNSSFTKNAKILAAANNCKLVNNCDELNLKQCFHF